MIVLDHALRLLIASSPNSAELRESWSEISASLSLERADPSAPSSQIFLLAIKQCSARIADQINQVLAIKSSSDLQKTIDLASED